MPDVCDVPVISSVCSAAGDATKAVAMNMIDAAAQAFASSFAKLAATLLTFWTNVTVPNLESPDGPVAFLRSSTSWLAAFVLVLSLVICGGKMAITARHEHGVEAAKGVWTYLWYSGAGIPGVMLLGVAGDQFSEWIINRAADGDLGGRLATLFNLAGLSGPLGTGLVLIMAVLGILSALGQMFLMIMRIGMLVLLAGMLPLSAAAAVSQGGKAWFSKTLGWLLAFAAYKPAAAIIYAAAFALVKGNGTTEILSGLFLLSLSVLALPALLRLTVPVTAAVAAGAAGGGAGVGAVGAVATGAMQMRAGSAAAGAGSGSRVNGAGPSGGQATPGQRPTPGGGSGPTGGTPRPGQPGAAGAGGAPGSAGAGAGAGAKAGAGAAGGPVGAGVAAGAQVIQHATGAARSAADNAAGGKDNGNGPSGPTGAREGGRR
ncbi:hypothetical protein GCM10012275_60730 [Longimycelium tulufanense]|uniref:TrbL/VirB6 plasmid conjugal transfer protein n=1 Tax=Longimycelium tulufanense TaxID=907463 RepID=A0A8J3FZN0_9PSEU|nr:hypothetical protein [Longimycelium tulufanense]GGM81974.1 hypothetical protein GCM10012275_60730 [Longimycelium tulufanense]